jgi:hypothetical protein
MNSPSTRKKLSDLAKLRWANMSEEEKNKYRVRGAYYSSLQPKWTDEMRKQNSGPGNHFYGRHHTEETKNKLSQLGSKRRMSLASRLKISETLKKNKINVGEKNGMKKQENRDKVRKTIIKLVEKNHGHALPFYNPKACEYFDGLSEKMGWSLRHAKNGGEVYLSELGYFLDSYDQERNIVVEYDEPRHYYVDGRLKPRDIYRQSKIIDHLKCKFYRYNERESLLYEVNVPCWERKRMNPK